MSRPSKHIDFIQELLDKYRFPDPVSPEMKRRINRSARKSLKVILKKAGRYSLFTAFALSIYWFVRKFGLGWVASKAIAIIISIGLILGIPAAGYFTYIYFTKVEPLAEIGAGSAKGKMGDEDLAGLYSTGFIPLMGGAGVDIALRQKINRNLLQAMLARKGARFTRFISYRQERSYPHKIYGEILFIEEEGLYIIKLKLKDTRTTQYYSFNETGTADDIGAMCQRIAVKLVNKYDEVR